MRIFYRVSGPRYSPRSLGILDKWKAFENLRRAFDVPITIMADNAYDEVCEKWNPTIVSRLGNSGSFRHLLQLALELPDDEIVYFVEDDYLHTRDAQQCLKEGFAIAPLVSLYDHLDKYQPPRSSIIYHTDSTHWRTAVSTCMTFAARVKTLKEASDVMVQYLDRPVPRDHEMFQALHRELGLELITPIPGRATHIGQYMSPVINWNKIDWKA